VSSSPREYTAFKYSAPPGSCKCGKCQLVPRERLDAWAIELDRARVAQQPTSPETALDEVIINFGRATTQTEISVESRNAAIKVVFDYLANQRRRVPAQPRTCATCNAVLADGPQPAATYAPVSSPHSTQDHDFSHLSDLSPEAQAKFIDTISLQERTDPDVEALNEEIKEMRRAIVTRQERGKS
jgi:hypothetical protein